MTVLIDTGVLYADHDEDAMRHGVGHSSSRRQSSRPTPVAVHWETKSDHAAVLI